MSTTVDLGKITASVDVGTTTTGAAGTNASVTNVGTTQDAVLNFNIPRGAQGVQGPQGIQGNTGPAGPTGPQGPMGDVAVITPEQQAAFTMYSVPGQNTDGPMTQKAVTDALVAGSISYDNSQSGLAAENVQGAINEMADVIEYKEDIVFGIAIAGFAIQSNNTWKKASSSHDYSSYVHEVTAGEKYIIKNKDAAGSRVHYGFLSGYTSPVEGDAAPFINGEGLRFITEAGKSLTLVIPEGTHFLYIGSIYNNDNIEPDYIQRVDDVKDKLQEYEAFNNYVSINEQLVDWSSQSVVSGYTINIVDAKWVQSNNVSCYLIPVSTYDVVRIVPNSNSSMIAFLTSFVHPHNTYPHYCEGYTNAIRVESEKVMAIPKDCTYLFVYDAYTTTSYLPQLYLGKSAMQLASENHSIDKGYLMEKEERVRCIDPSMSVIAATSYVLEVKPCQKIWITGATGFMWLKTNVIQQGGSNPYSASDYFNGWCECDSDGVELYAAPDCHYLMIDTNVDVYGFEEYKDFSKYDTDLLSLASYISNRSVRYIYHTYIRTMHGGGYNTALTGIGSTNEHSHRNPAALVSHLDVMLNSPTLDLGLIGTSKYALRNQCIRYLQALVDAHSLWTNKWQSSLTAAYMGSASCRLYRDGYMTQELYDDVRDIVATESDNILSKQVGDRWDDNVVFGIYWKNASGTELYSGDSKSEEVGWYAGCLGVACALCQDYPNIQEYRRKFVEFSIISYASPSDIGKNESYNGYSLNNLQGSNITDDGMVINHSIIHPDYMTSRCFTLFFCLRALNYAGISMPKAMLFNMRLILSGLTDYKFTSEKYLGKYQPVPPYGEIMPDGANYPYFPMGNDWGTLRQDVEAEFFSLLYALGQSPRYDCSRTAINVLATIKKLQDRFETYHSGRIVGNSGENMYGVEEAPYMQYANVGSTMVCPFGIVEFLTSELVWSDDDWYNNE